MGVLKVRAAVGDSEGLPVCVQIVAAPFQDETALHIMAELEAALPN